MKITIDTKAKTIEVEGDVVLYELFIQLGKMLPNGAWKSYKLTTSLAATIAPYPYTPSPYINIPSTNPHGPITFHDGLTVPNIIGSSDSGTFTIDGNDTITLGNSTGITGTTTDCFTFVDDDGIDLSGLLN